MTSNRVIVIGAGIGGLVAAAILSHQGYEVIVLERASTIGGKIRQIHINGRPIDAGPTVFTMRNIFEGIFAAAGSQLDHHLSLQPLHTLARHYWNEEQRLDLFADKHQSADAISTFSSPSEGRNYLAFCQQTEKIFNVLHKSYITASRPTLLELVTRIGFKNFNKLFDIKPFSKMYASLSSQFKDKRLRQLFGRYSTYCGSSPYMSPATLLLIAHVEQSGVWSIDGGMHQLVKALHNVAIANGAKFYFDQEVQEINLKYDRVSSVTSKTEENFECEKIICNTDLNALASGLLGSNVSNVIKPSKNKVNSLSAITWCSNATKINFPLSMHNVFFSNNYEQEFNDLFKYKKTTDQPTVYICAQDRIGKNDRDNQNVERLFCLINAPPNGEKHQYTKQEIKKCSMQMNETFKRCGFEFDINQHNAVATSPSDFANLFPATNGALYGQATHGWQASFQRPGSRSVIPGLYLAGGSVHPGPGIPMAATSGLLAANSLINDDVR